MNKEKNKSELFQNLVNYFQTPSAEILKSIINNLKFFIINYAQNWKCSYLSLNDKINEIITEIFFAINEDIDINKIYSAESFISYLSLRLKRLSYNNPKLYKTFISPNENLLYNISSFTPFITEITNEIVKTIRLELYINEKNLDTQLLEFSFIHIYPEVKWATKILHKNNNYKKDLNAIYELYKKRHQTFHRNLRIKLQNINIYDVSEIHSWNSSEKRYLAWNIIDFNFNEIQTFGKDLYADICKYRENPQLAEDSNDYLKLANNVISQLKNSASKIIIKNNVAQDTTLVSDNQLIYGNSKNNQDVFKFLFKSNYKNKYNQIMNKYTTFYDNNKNYKVNNNPNSECNETKSIDSIFDLCVNNFIINSKHIVDYKIKKERSSKNNIKKIYNL